MPAHEHINSEQYFHGTNAEVQGDTILPSSKIGRENYDYALLPDPEKRRNSVFMTRGGGYFSEKHIAEGRAWMWSGAGGSGQRRRVHVVEPQGETSTDTEAHDAVMASSAKVKDTLWTPPPHTEWAGTGGRADDQVVQGTLPPQNWNDYRAETSTKEANWHAYSPSADRRKKAENDRWETGPAPVPRTSASSSSSSRGRAWAASWRPPAVQEWSDMDPRREVRQIHKHFGRYHQDIGEAVIYFRFNAVDSAYDSVYDEGYRQYLPGVRMPILWVDQMEAMENYAPEGRRPTTRIRLAVSAQSMHECGISITEASGNQLTDVSPSEVWREDRMHDIFYYDGRFFEVSGFQIRGRVKGEDVIMGMTGIETFPADDAILDNLPGSVVS